MGDRCTIIITIARNKINIIVISQPAVCQQGSFRLNNVIISMMKMNFKVFVEGVAPTRSNSNNICVKPLLFSRCFQ